MEIQEIKQRLARPAVKLIAGGFRPVGTDEESWLGNVFLFRPDEDVPTNQAGQPLLPYAQFYLPALPVHSPLLAGVRVLTVFISNPFPEHFEPMGIIGSSANMGRMICWCASLCRWQVHSSNPSH